MIRILALHLPLFFAAVAAASAQQAPAAWPQEQSDLPPHESLHFGRLDNGFRYIIMPHAEPPERVSLRLYVDAGSLSEEEDQRGLAHFLEHMAFNGTRQFKSTEIVEFLQRLGMAFGPDINAHTSFDETVYKLDLPDVKPETLTKGISILRDWADGMLLDAEEIEKERGVILKEKLGRDTIAFRMMEAEFAFLLPDSLLPKRMPIGTDDVITSAPRQRFVDFYQTHYTPERMMLVVVGDVDVDAIEETVREAFASMKPAAKVADAPDFGAINAEGLRTRAYREPEASATSVSITALKPYQTERDTVDKRLTDFPIDVANDILNRRFSILAKKPEAPFTNGAAYTTDLFEFAEITGVELSCQPEQWKASLEVAEQELRRALEHGFTDAELEEAKANLLNAYERAVETAPSRKAPELANAIVVSVGADEVYTSPETDLQLAMRALAELTTSQCQEALRQHWNSDNMNVMVSGNYEEDLSDDAVAEVYQSSLEEPVAPPELTADLAFAYSSLGAPGEITSRTEVADLGITRLTFENGVRVNLKPTDFQKDTIMITTRFGGGKLSQPLDKPGIDMFAGATFDAGGLEKHSADELQRLFAGKNVTSSFGISEDAFNLAGRTTPKDLSDQLNLMCATFIAAGYREEAQERLRKMLPMIDKQLESTPEGVLQAKVEPFLHGGDPRFGIPPMEVLVERNLAEVKAWVDPALKSSPLEVSLVGDFELEPTIEALRATFGALPPRDSERPNYEEARQVRFPSDVRDNRFSYESKIDKSITLVVWPTTDRRDHIHEARRLSVIAAILDDRVRKEIREELGEAYSPQASSEGSDTFPGYGQLYVMSPGAPGKAAEVADLIVDIGADLAASGTDADELERALNPILTGLQEQTRNNRYWLNSVLAASQEYPSRLDWARSLEEDFRSITVEEINALAKKYLDRERALKVIISTP